ncbi:MAG TPA: DUF6125 family protein [Armatimonadota bacterium]|nr:DUF6125 family protein [Armatimonadota bacterium]
MFDDKAIIEFLRRSYFAVDGLWFVCIEDEHSFEEAMRLDEQVWEILPKIQARNARELLKIGGGTLADLALGLWLKFAAEGYDHRVVERTPDILRISIRECPWLKILDKAGRMSKAAEICDSICTRDFSTWAAQFSPGIKFSLESKLSEGAPACELVFTCSAEIQPAPRAEREAAG